MSRRTFFGPEVWEMSHSLKKAPSPADNYRDMKNTLFITITLLSCAAFAHASEPEMGLDSNTAFYEGEAFSYTMSAPDGYKLVTYFAKLDGYSFAFIPKDQTYDSASIILGVHIYKIRGMTFGDALLADTSAVRAHYGGDLILNPVEGTTNATNHSLTTFYLDDKSRFIPNVMMSYFPGGNEMVIMELVITPGVMRVQAEEVFMSGLKRFKALMKGELGAG